MQNRSVISSNDRRGSPSRHPHQLCGSPCPESAPYCDDGTCGPRPCETACTGITACCGTQCCEMGQVCCIVEGGPIGPPGCYDEVCPGGCPLCP